MDDKHEVHLAVSVLGPALDELPAEKQPGYKFLTQFRGYVRESRIAVGSGAMSISIAVPYEDKYAALPITDLRGVTFLITVLRPVMASPDDPDADEIVWMDNNNG